ncbi:MAG TPA: carboxymuconolactone decarboxylase family protein [Parvularculaceae bacterium]|nr:carboxymuconolactone decarboxylase family protein [Parvularculaceae bacterium]HNS87342.1 carboxymuconolactone decarboxylase family protein [Parvularculaceae bacterium]
MSRIKPLSPPYENAVRADFERVMPPGAPPLVLFRTVAVSKRAWEKFKGGSLLDRGPLSLHAREIIIDRTCARANCEYEWGVHAVAFAEAAKLTPEQIAATVHEDANAVCWSPEEKALIRCADALHDRATLSDEEFSALAEYYDAEQILEIIMLAGFYRTVAYLANGLKLPLERNAAMFPAKQEKA